MKICVVSDIHFKYDLRNDDDRFNHQTVLDFFHSIIGAYDLLILNGDIFDLWFDWKYTIVKQYFPLLKMLSDISEQGCRIVYTSGNHDFWFNDFLTKYLNIEVYQDDFTILADGKNILCSHGDLHTSNDIRYQIFRRVIRLPFVKNVFSLIHPDLSLRLSTYLSRSSRGRKISPMMKSRRSIGLVNYATRRLKQFDIVILGHNHKPMVKQIQNGVYANCGDWIEHYSYLEIIDGFVSLKYYINNKE